MFLNGHDLNTVVTVGHHSGQDIFLEFGISTHFLGILSHTDVTFVDEQRVLVGFKTFLLPGIRLLRIPHLCREYLGGLVLHHTLCPCRNTLTRPTVPIDMHLEKIAVFHALFGYLEFPVACALDACGLVFVCLLPVVEITHQIDGGCVGCPFPEHPSSFHLVQSVVVVSTGKVFKSLLAIACQLVDFPHGMVVSALDGILKRLQIAVVLYQSDVFRRILSVFLARLAGLLGFICLMLHCHL